jgi:dipeptidyl aminopeptidase/acylaminoacyl peptidase
VRSPGASSILAGASAASPGRPRAAVLPDYDRPIGPGLFGDSSAFPEGADIAWDEDGQGLAVQVQDEGSVYPIHVRLADGQRTRLVPESFRGNCASLRLAGDVYWSVVDSSADAAEVCEIPRAGGEPVRCTDVNRTALAAWGAEPFEEIRYSSPDGTPVHAFVAKPAEFAPGQRYPLVLLVHGGPHGMFGHAFEHEALFHTSQGRVVLMVNPRGSYGYGQAFSAGCVNDWGGGDFQDIMAGVDELIARGWVDPARMAVNGISYGGYMSSWILTHTDRFACAIPEMLVSDLVAMWGTSDIGWFLMEEQAGGSPLDGGRGLWAHSPLAYAHQAKTPTLIIDGEADFRCPIGQGEELFTALRRQGVEAVLVRLQGVSHVAAFLGPPRLRRARKALIQRFLVRHGVGGEAQASALADAVPAAGGEHA